MLLQGDSSRARNTQEGLDCVVTAQVFFHSRLPKAPALRKGEEPKHSFPAEPINSSLSKVSQASKENRPHQHPSSVNTASSCPFLEG